METTRAEDRRNEELYPYGAGWKYFVLMNSRELGLSNVRDASVFYEHRIRSLALKDPYIIMAPHKCDNRIMSAGNIPIAPELPVTLRREKVINAGGEYLVWIGQCARCHLIVVGGGHWLHLG